MKLFKKMKDGGPESTAVGYWLIEAKSCLSIVLLNFQGKSREAYHTHAFPAISWLLKGSLREEMHDGKVNYYFPSWKPIITPRNTFHKVSALDEQTWAFSLRGRWVKNWKEYLPETHEYVTLAPGRVEVERVPAG